MTTIKRLVLIISVCSLAACDKDFEAINTNPYAINDIDPGLLFAGAQRIGLGNGWDAENTIVQQFVNPFNSGATLGPNFNEDIDGVNNGTWTAAYTGSIKNFNQALSLIGTSTNRPNLKSMIRIMKAFSFMNLADTYGDVPYFDAGKAYLETIYYPKYDDDAVIYADLEKELRESIAALNPAGDFVTSDLFFGSRGSIPTSTSGAQVEKWKKLGNSLLLRLGMRYSKSNPTKAASIASEAFNGGVMTSNSDNAYVKYDGTFYTNGANGNLINNNPYFYYAAEPFVNQLKATNDPRTKNFIARFANPGSPSADPNPNTVIAEQYGVPVGVKSDDLKKAPYRGSKNAGFDYSQFNIKAIASQTAPTFWVTYSQTALLLAEAANRGWITGGNAAAQNYYESAIIADMDRHALYPGASPISTIEKTAYLLDPGVIFNPLNALKLINTQYWIVSLTSPLEAWSNFRRSGFPALSPNNYNNNLSGGFIRRLSYPDPESSNNEANYFAAVKAIGGKDDLITRVFWDK